MLIDLLSAFAVPLNLLLSIAVGLKVYRVILRHLTDSTPPPPPPAPPRPPRVVGGGAWVSLKPTTAPVCRYCGQALEGGKCHHCGGPQE